MRTFMLLALAAAGAVAAGQTGFARDLAPGDLLKPLAASWTSYSGDYTGRRYSALTQINQANVKQLSLAWTVKLTAGAGPAGRWGEGAGAITGGHGAKENPAVPTIIKGSPLMVNGVLYVTSPDNGWALDANDGREVWHYFWRTRGGTPIGNRGFGLWNNYLFMVTPDDFVVSLDAKTGKERWNKEFAPFTQQYFATIAPMVIGNKVIVGTGNDLDSPGYLQAYDVESGKELWRFYTVPQTADDPGVDTWPSLQAARYGGGHPWLPGVYDPETNLYIFGTGNPIPAYTLGRGEGDNLFTCSLIAVDVETGKMKWYFQTSPHDMHDWDSAQTPVLFEATVGGKKRKLIATAARNGYFFTLDRTTGEKIVAARYGSATNWAKTIDAKGSVRREPTKDPIVPGALVSPTSGGTINWEPPAYSPQTGLFYVSERNGHSIYYLTDPDPRGSMGLAGKEEVFVGNTGNFLTAIEPLTGKVAWRRPYPSAGGSGMYGGGGAGLLATAGKLVFGSDNGGNLIAYDAATGTPLWHSRIGEVTNPPITYMHDGRQFVLVAATDTLYAFALYQ